jgi:2-methylcitrate dehydratase PrpD
MDPAPRLSADSEPLLRAFIELSRTMRWDSVAATTRASVRRELLDYLGAAVAGRAAAGRPRWLEVLTDMGGRPDARVLGGARVPAPVAALCNGYYGHVLEFDDTHDEAVLHAGAAAIPAAFAAAGLRGAVGGREFCEAVLLGVELTCRLGVATKLNLVEGGWIYTALFGHFGAAFAAARLVDPRPECLRNALGIAYCLASGNHQSTREGAPTKHVQPGFAAANGLTAAMMASGGLSGVRLPVTGEDGLNRVYLHGRLDPSRAMRGLGAEWEFDRLSIKPYPTCRLTHPSISAALDLRARPGFDHRKIDRLEIVMGPQAHDVVGRDAPEKRLPQSRVNAQFSAHWCVANALVHGEVTPRQLAEEIPPSPEVAAVISKISCRADTAATRDIGGCTLLAHGSFGIEKATRASARGHPDFPLSEEELLAKFRGNLRYARVSESEAARLADEIMEIDGLDDIVPLWDRLAGICA